MLDINIKFPDEVEDAVFDAVDKFVNSLQRIPDVEAIAVDETAFVIARI